MEKNKDGPQAATRHVKDRRPAYYTNAARSIATIERRLSALECRQPLSQSFPSAARAAVASDLDADLNKFGMMYNSLEQRISELENRHGRPNEIHERLSAIEERLKPFEDYRTQALNAVEQLHVFHQRLSKFNTVRPDNRVCRLVDEHDASLRAHSGRLKALEQQSELAQITAVSTRDLAQALVMRLEHGDSIDVEIIRTLLSYFKKTENDNARQRSVMTVRLPETPATDEVLGTYQTSIEASTKSVDGSGKKRKRSANSIEPPNPSNTVGREESDIERCISPDVNDALNAFSDGDFSALENCQTQPSSEFHNQPERRSCRKSQQTKRHKEMICWGEANRKLRGA